MPKMERTWVESRWNSLKVLRNFLTRFDFVNEINFRGLLLIRDFAMFSELQIIRNIFRALKLSKGFFLNITKIHSTFLKFQLMTSKIICRIAVYFLCKCITKTEEWPFWSQQRRFQTQTDEWMKKRQIHLHRLRPLSRPGILNNVHIWHVPQRGQIIE